MIDLSLGELFFSLLKAYAELLPQMSSETQALHFILKSRFSLQVDDRQVCTCHDIFSFDDAVFSTEMCNIRKVPAAINREVTSFVRRSA